MRMRPTCITKDAFLLHSKHPGINSWRTFLKIISLFFALCGKITRMHPNIKNTYERLILTPGSTKALSYICISVYSWVYLQRTSTIEKTENIHRLSCFNWLTYILSVIVTTQKFTEDLRGVFTWENSHRREFHTWMTFLFRIAFTLWLGHFISRYLKVHFMLIKYT